MDASITIKPSRYVTVDGPLLAGALMLTLPQARALYGALRKWDNEGLLDGGEGE